MLLSIALIFVAFVVGLLLGALVWRFGHDPGKVRVVPIADLERAARERAAAQAEMAALREQVAQERQTAADAVEAHALAERELRDTREELTSVRHEAATARSREEARQAAEQANDLLRTQLELLRRDLRQREQRISELEGVATTAGTAAQAEISYLRSRVDAAESEIAVLRARSSAAEAGSAGAEDDTDDVDGPDWAAAGSLADPVEVNGTHLAAAGLADAATAPQEIVLEEADDLTRVEGIGPAISAALVATGIGSFAALSRSDEQTLRAALDTAGLRLAPSLPSWPRRAGELLADAEGVTGGLA